MATIGPNELESAIQFLVAEGIPWRNISSTQSAKYTNVSVRPEGDFENGNLVVQASDGRTFIYRRDTYAPDPPPEQEPTEPPGDQGPGDISVDESTPSGQLSTEQEQRLQDDEETDDDETPGEQESEEDQNPDAEQENQQEVAEQGKNIRNPGNERIFTRDNLLKKYATFTYNITLSILSVEDLNRIYEQGALTGGYKRKPGSVLIQSGGIQQKFRNKHFDIDYLIDDLKIESIIGVNGFTRNTHNANISFMVVEPYGISLIERLIKASLDAGAGNYVQQPYMLEIEFTGYDDSGAPIRLPEITKKIPIKLVNLNIKTGMEGTQYQIDAIPYSHESLRMQNMTIPFNLEVNAKRVKDIFNGSIVTVTEREARPTDQAAQPGDTITQRSTVKGLADAINRYNQSLVDREKMEFADEYEFTFEGKIGDATFNLESVLGVPENEVPMEEEFAEAIKNSLSKNFTYDKDRKLFRINQGTSIVEIINTLIKGSSYMRDQIDVDDIGSIEDAQEAARKRDKPIWWWKITTDIRLGKYDRIRRRYQYRIGIHVKSMLIKGKNYEGMGQQKITTAHKNYEYAFTGRNDDVMDMTFEFNSAYFQARNVLGNKIEPEDQSCGNVAPFTVQTVPHTSTSQGKGTNDQIDYAVADVMQDILSTAPELASLDLKIYGDPDWIPQDDIYPDKPLRQLNTSAFTRSGSLNAIANEIYVKFLSKTPTDYNQATGLMDLEGNKFSQESLLISGNYTCVSVKSQMVGGMFTQDLQLVRRFDKDKDCLNPKNQERSQDRAPASERERVSSSADARHRQRRSDTEVQVQGPDEEEFDVDVDAGGAVI